MGHCAAGGDRPDPQSPRLPHGRRCRASAGGRSRCAAIPAEYYETMAREYAERRERMLKMLTEAGFRCGRPKGAYYIMADISAFGFPDDVSFARHLVKDIGVAAVPGSSFYRNPADGRTQLRFTFCKTEKTMKLAGRRKASEAEGEVGKTALVRAPLTSSDRRTACTPESLPASETGW